MEQLATKTRRIGDLLVTVTGPEDVIEQEFEVDIYVHDADIESACQWVDAVGGPAALDPYGYSGAVETRDDAGTGGLDLDLTVFKPTDDTPPAPPPKGWVADMRELALKA